MREGFCCSICHRSGRVVGRVISGPPLREQSPAGQSQLGLCAGCIGLALSALIAEDTHRTPEGLVEVLFGERDDIHIRRSTEVTEGFSDAASLKELLVEVVRALREGGRGPSPLSWPSDPETAQG